jgi:predicted transcriptional regulator
MDHEAMTAAAPPGESVMLTVRVSRAYREFLARLAERERCSRADVIDKAVAEFARRDGIEPPKR